MTFELTLSSIFLRGLAFLAITALHGLFLAGAARLLGDKGPGYDGRLHAGPFGHLDVLGMVTAVLTLWGWIRPMRIDAPELKGGRWGLVACVVLSLAAVVVTCMLLQLLRAPAVALLPPSLSNQVTAWLNVLGQMSVVFAVVNLVPLPPFTGGHLLNAFAPKLHELAMSRVTLLSLGLCGLGILDRSAYVSSALRPLVQALTW